MTSRRTRLASITPQPAAFRAGLIRSAQVSASFIQCFYMKTAYRSIQSHGLADTMMGGAGMGQGGRRAGGVSSVRCAI